MSERKFKHKNVIGATFVGTAVLVLVNYLIIRTTGMIPNKTLLVFLWCAFYISSFVVMIYGGLKSAALEATVYFITIIGEAVAPDLCERIIKQLPDAAISHEMLDSVAHLTLTLMSCALLIGWAGVLIFQAMRAGGTQVWAIAYVFLTLFVPIGVILAAVLAPTGFVGLEAANQGVYIRGVWPSMFDVPMSYVRILLTLMTMFLPWVKVSMENHSPEAGH